MTTRRERSETDWYVTTRYAVGLVRVRYAYVYAAPPIWGWMIGKKWKTCKAWIISKGGHGEPLPSAHS